MAVSRETRGRQIRIAAIASLNANVGVCVRKKGRRIFLRAINSRPYIRKYIARNDKISRGHTPGRKFRRCYRTFLSHRCDFLSFPPLYYDFFFFFFLVSVSYLRETRVRGRSEKRRRKLRRHALALPVSGPSHKDRDGLTYHVFVYVSCVFVHPVYCLPDRNGERKRHRRRAHRTSKPAKRVQVNARIIYI